MIRPVRLLRDQSHDLPLVGHIEKCVFLGSFTRITLNVDDKRLVLELRGRRTDLKPGAALAVRIPAGAIHRLQDATE